MSCNCKELLQEILRVTQENNESLVRLHDRIDTLESKLSDVEMAVATHG